jgi:hypothetical protein
MNGRRWRVSAVDKVGYEQVLLYYGSNYVPGPLAKNYTNWTVTIWHEIQRSPNFPEMGWHGTPQNFHTLIVIDSIHWAIWIKGTQKWFIQITERNRMTGTVNLEYYSLEIFGKIQNKMISHLLGYTNHFLILCTCPPRINFECNRFDRVPAL